MIPDDDGGCYVAQELKAVSNGSIQKGVGSHACVLVGREDDMLYMTGAGPVDGGLPHCFCLSALNCKVKSQLSWLYA